MDVFQRIAEAGRPDVANRAFALVQRWETGVVFLSLIVIAFGTWMIYGAPDDIGLVDGAMVALVGTLPFQYFWLRRARLNRRAVLVAFGTAEKGDGETPPDQLH